jgi:toxin ParE1/3/4
MRIRWFAAAIQDLISLRQYIAAERPEAAADVAARILNFVENLSIHPELGRTGRVEGTRELVIAELPFIIPYRVRNKTVEILRVLHTSRRWPTRFKK